MPNPELDEAFASQANRSGMVSSEQVDQARLLQKKLSEDGTPVSLADAMVQAGAITPLQKENVLKQIESRKAGGIRKLGQYTLIRKLGQGAMGAVYLGEDTLMQRKVAIKILPRKSADDAKFLARFKREAQAAGNLNHENICGAFAVGEDQGHHYYVMEYLTGQSLGDRIKERKRIECDDAIQIIMQAARGLQYAHQNGFVHRDIKPDNIMLTSDGVVKVLDLGLTKNIEAEGEDAFLTQDGSAVGTPHYISPEQARGQREVDGRTDIYSLGATFYYMVTGSRPFEAPTGAAVMLKHLKEQAPDPRDLNGEIPAGVVQVIRRMMGREAQDRYSDCKALLDDLELILDGHEPNSQVLAAEKSSVAAAKGAFGESRRSRRSTGPREPVGERRAGRRATGRRDAVRRRRTAGSRKAGEYEDQLSPASTSKVPTYVGIGAAAAILAVVAWFMASSGKTDTRTARKGRKPTKKVEERSPEVKTSVKPSTSDAEHAASKKTVKETVDPTKKVATEPPKDPETNVKPQTYRLEEAAWKDAIDLLPLIDPKRDAVRGDWVRHNRTELLSDDTSVARIQIPYRVPEEYDFLVEFTRRRGSDWIGQLLSHQGRSFCWIMGAYNNGVLGFSEVGGRLLAENPTKVERPSAIPIGKRHTSLVMVRKNEVNAYLDGELISSWRTEHGELSANEYWRLRDTGVIGLASRSSPTLFHRARVREVTGKGTVIRRPSEVATTPKPSQPEKTNRPEIHLSDLKPERVENAVKDYFDLGNGPKWATPCKGRKCVYMHAQPNPRNPSVTWRLPGPYKQFKARICNFHPASGAVWFSVWGDGKELWKSKPMVGRTPAVPCTVKIEGVKLLTLKTHSKRPTDAHTTWIEPIVTNSSPVVTNTPPASEDQQSLSGTARQAAYAKKHGLQKELTLDLGGDVKMAFVLIPPGTFVMGGTNSVESRFGAVETPKHKVKITKPFYLGKYEVTQAQYQILMGKNPSKSTRAPDCPVSATAYNHENAFCKRAAKKTGQGVRLPTEAEWEYACRADSDSPWSHGADPARLTEYAWTAANSGLRSHPVGRKKPNRWGLYDMHGNVCERVADMYHRTYYANSPKEDPTGAKVGFSRGNNGTTILRGGTWKCAADRCQAGSRLRGGGYASYHNWGFRVALSIPEDRPANRKADAPRDRTTGLVGHWTFDDGSGPVAGDSSGNNNLGKLIGGPKWVKEGKVGGALRFDGKDDYVHIKASNTTRVGSSLTMALWFMPDRNINNKPLIEWSSTRAIGVHMWINVKSFSGSGANLTDMQGQFHFSGGVTSVVANQWQHLAVTYDGKNESRVFLNGQMKKVHSLGAFKPKTDLDILLGARIRFNGRRFIGLLDDVRIYNRALSAEEVKALFEMGAAKPDIPANALHSAAQGRAPARMGQYVLRKRLGVGPAGSTYQVYDEKSKREVCLKVGPTSKLKEEERKMLESRAKREEVFRFETIGDWFLVVEPLK